MLTVNVSDFIVQEILERLWACYVMKYGENDAKDAEKSFYASRKQPGRALSIIQTRPSLLDIVDEHGGATDAKRKYMKQYSDVGIGLLKSTSAAEPILTSTREQNQQA